jgi:hypothetical protein
MHDSVFTAGLNLENSTRARMCNCCENTRIRWFSRAGLVLEGHSAVNVRLRCVLGATLGRRSA